MGYSLANDMHKVAYLINRFFMHLHGGALPMRIKEEWHKSIRRRRMIWWNTLKNKKEYFTYPLQRKIKINLYFDSELCRLIYCDNFEWSERQFLNNYLKSGDVFVDIGANIGLFTLIASHSVGNKGKIYSFEPCLKTFQRLIQNTQLNRIKNTQCIRLALSDHRGQTQMNVSLDGYNAWNSIGQPTAGRFFTTETVDVTTWDDFVHEHHLAGRVTMMKIDVEGWESRVLSGGIETLSRADAPDLQVEFTDKAAESANTSCQALYRQLEGLGYRMFVYDEKSGRIVHDPIRDEYPYTNLLASKNPDIVQVRLNKKR